MVCRRVQTCASCWPPWITRWNCIESRPMDHSMELQPGPLGSMVVHHAGAGIHGCASCWPWDPWLCILLALGSIVVHHAGPGIHGCASCWPWDPWLCIESRPAAPTSPGPQGIAAAGPVGVDHSMELQPGPLGSIEGTASSTGPQGIAAAGYPGGRCPTTGFLLPVSYFPNALRTHKRTHCERMLDRDLLLDTMVAVTRGMLNCLGSL